MTYPELLTRLIDHRDLSEAETAAAVDELLSGTWSDGCIGAFLAAMACKGETVAELTGASRAMRRKAARIQALGGAVLDTCGTGGDGAGTFNISTATAFVAAGAGATVAKHGNRSVSSRCGSADVLEALGMCLDTPPEIMEQALGEIGIAFLFAPVFHGAMRHAMPVRKQLGVRSIFNMLGPLTNPAGASGQLLGVFAPELTEMFAETLRNLGARRAFVVHGQDGLDEITLTGPTRVSELRDGRIETYDIEPGQFGISAVDPNALEGGDSQVNAEILREVLSGAPGPRREVVRLNAAAALAAVGIARDIRDGLHLAAESMDNGAAAAKLQALIDFTRENAG